VGKYLDILRRAETGGYDKNDKNDKSPPLVVYVVSVVPAQRSRRSLRPSNDAARIMSRPGVGSRQLRTGAASWRSGASRHTLLAGALVICSASTSRQNGRARTTTVYPAMTTPAWSGCSAAASW
jgi:hypothetical protein